MEGAAQAEHQREPAGLVSFDLEDPLDPGAELVGQAQVHHQGDRRAHRLGGDLPVARLDRPLQRGADVVEHVAGDPRRRASIRADAFGLERLAPRRHEARVTFGHRLVFAGGRQARVGEHADRLEQTVGRPVCVADEDHQ